MEELTDIFLEGKQLTLNQLLDVIENADDQDVPNSGIDVTIFPPNNATGDLTDEDSGGEENPQVENLPASQLMGIAEINDPLIINLIRNVDHGASSSERLSTLSPKKKKRKYSKKKVKMQPLNLNWKSSELAVPTDNWQQMQKAQNALKSPLEYFQLFFDKEIMELILIYTNQFAAKRNKLGDVSEQELLSFIGVLLLSGYICYPRRGMYWQNESDSHHDLVSQALSRDRFDFIMSNLHVCNNDKLEKTDKFAKIRPLISIMNERFKNFAPHERNHSVDESMIPYFGRHGLKQFIRGKPIRYGFKFWSGCTSNGFVVWLEPYQGAGTCSKMYEDKGMGYGVVMSYADQLLCDTPYRFFFDNLFTSPQLLYDLSSRGIEGTGTVRRNRLGKGCPLTPIDIFKKEKRGSFEVFSDQSASVSVVQWNDNNIVNMSTNFDQVHPLQHVKRYSGAVNKKVNIQQPKMINAYNKNMGGVDRADQNISLYRVSIRGKKWYFPLIAHIVDVAEQNAWQLHKIDGGKLDHLAFRRRIAKNILESAKGTKLSRGRPSKEVKIDSRYDRVDHFILSLPREDNGKRKQLKCGLCHKKTTTKCTKCDISLHVDCFLPFHTK